MSTNNEDFPVYFEVNLRGGGVLKLPTREDCINNVAEAILTRMKMDRDGAIFTFSTSDGLLHAAIDCSEVVGFSVIKDLGKSGMDSLAERRMKAEIRYFESLSRGESWRGEDDLE